MNCFRIGLTAPENPPSYKIYIAISIFSISNWVMCTDLSTHVLSLDVMFCEGVEAMCPIKGKAKQLQIFFLCVFLSDCLTTSKLNSRADCDILSPHDGMDCIC